MLKEYASVLSPIRELKNTIMLLTISFVLAMPASAFQWKDSGWIAHGKTAAQQQFLRRDIEIRLNDGTKTGFSYVHKKGMATRGTKIPALTLGDLTYHKNWSSYSLFDLTVNDESSFIAKHITEVPEFEFLEKGIESFVLRLHFSLGEKGKVVTEIRAARDNDYFDFNFDFSGLKIENAVIAVNFNAWPSHTGTMNRPPIEPKRIYRSMNELWNKTRGTFQVPPKDNWVLLYDQEFGAGACGLLFNPKQISEFSVAGASTVIATAKLNPEVTEARFFLWEFDSKNYNSDTIFSYMKDNDTVLTQAIATPFTKSTEQSARPAYTAIETSSPVKLDGKMTEEAWAAAPWAKDFYDLKSSRISSEQTRFKVIYDDSHFFIGIDSDEPGLTQFNSKVHEHDDDAIFKDDGIELFIGPDNSVTNYYHMAFNTSGSRWDSIFYPEERKSEKTWNPKWEVKTYLRKDGWSAEVAIPFSELMLSSDTDKNWLFNIGRNNRTGMSSATHERYQTWSKLERAFHEVMSFNSLNGFGDLSHVYNPEPRSRWNLQTRKRGDKLAALGGDGIEIVAPGSNDFFMFYPHKELFFPADKTVLRTYFEFKETRSDILEMIRGKKGSAAQKQKLSHLEYHLLLPPGVEPAGDLFAMTMQILRVEKRGDRHLVLHPQLPLDYGEMWRQVKFDKVPLFLRHNLPAGSRLPLDSWVEYTDTKEKSSVIRSYVNIVDFPVVATSQKLVIDPFWGFFNDIRTFPNYAGAMKRVGFTGINIFAGDLLKSTGRWDYNYEDRFFLPKKKFLLELADEARKQGMKIYLCDTTFNAMGLSHQAKRWGETKYSDPTYRGELYWFDIKNITDAYEVLGGTDLVSMDIEQFKYVTKDNFGYFDASPKDAARIRAEADKKGMTIEEYWCEIGSRMQSDIKKQLELSDRKINGRGIPPILTWNACLDHQNPMEGMFDGRKIYPELNQYLNPHGYYAGDSRKVGMRARFHRRKMKNRDFIMCLTTNYHINFTVDQVRDQLLESIYNGAGGIQYWPQYLDQNHYYGQLQALREIVPFEDLIADGKWHCFTADENTLQIVGMRSNDEAVLLCSDYSGGGEFNLINPLGIDTDIYDVSSGKLLKRIKSGETLKVKCVDRNTRVLYFGSKWGKRVR